MFWFFENTVKPSHLIFICREMAWTLNPNHTPPSRDILSNHLMGQGGKVKCLIWAHWCQQSSHNKWRLNRHDAKPLSYSDSMLYHRRDETKAVYKSQTVVDQWQFTRIWYNESQVLADNFQPIFIWDKSKWRADSNQLALDQVVLTVDPQLPQVLWPVGKITDTHPHTGGFGPPPSKLSTTPIYAKSATQVNLWAFCRTSNVIKMNIWGGCRKSVMVMLHAPLTTIALVPHALMQYEIATRG